MRLSGAVVERGSGERVPWGKMDDKFHRNAKVRKLRRLKGGYEALGVWTFWWSWCLDDPELAGVVPDDELTPAERKSAALLIAVGLWDRVDGGYAFHDFDEYNPTRGQVEAKREADRERQRRARERDIERESRRDTRRDSPCDTGSDSDANPIRVASPARVPSQSPPDPSPIQIPTQPQPDPPRERVNFNSNTLEALFSKLRKAAQKGALKLQRSDYDRAQKAVEWAHEERPDNPASVCETGIAQYLAHATGLPAEQGYPFWGWANDPAAWLAFKPGNANGNRRGAPAQVAPRASHTADPMPTWAKTGDADG